MINRPWCVKGRKAVGALVFAGLMTAASPGQASQISFSDPEVNVSAGQGFTLDILGSFGTDYIYGESLDLTFDTNRLAVTAVAINPAVWDFFVSSFSNSATGVSDITFFANEDYPTGDFTLATVTFSALSAGNTSVDFTQVVLRGCAAADYSYVSEIDAHSCGSDDSFEEPVLVGSVVNIGVAPAFVPIPVPAAVWLLLSGMAGIGLSGKRRRV